MIRMVFPLRRQQHLDRDAFQSYWKDQHGPLVASYASVLNIQRYVQLHTLDDPINEGANKARGGNMEPPYDGVAELWWATEADLLAALASEAGQTAAAALVEDERSFIDLRQSPLWLAREYPQVNPTPENLVAHERSSLLKMHFPLRHPPGRDTQEVRDYWLQNHGPIIRSHAPASGLLRYLQVHRLEHPLEAVLREARGTEVETYLGHAEVWLDRNRSATPEARVASQAAVADESRFIDFERSALFVGKEHVIIDRRP